jgi:hypothetical protein
VDRLPCHRRPAGGRRSVESVWMLSVPLSTVGVGVVRHHVEEPVLEKVQGAVVGPAEPFAGFDHLVENGLNPCAAGDGAEDTADRALLLAQVLELASELVVGGRAGHLRSLGPGGTDIDEAFEKHFGRAQELGRRRAPA